MRGGDRLGGGSAGSARWVFVGLRQLRCHRLRIDPWVHSRAAGRLKRDARLGYKGAECRRATSLRHILFRPS